MRLFIERPNLAIALSLQETLQHGGRCLVTARERNHIWLMGARMPLDLTIK